MAQHNQSATQTSSDKPSQRWSRILSQHPRLARPTPIAARFAATAVVAGPRQSGARAARSGPSTFLPPDIEGPRMYTIAVI